MGDPFLIEEETIEINAKHGFPITILVISIVLTVIPPFIWGVGVFLLVRHSNKHNRTWVTNKRLVNFKKVPFTKKYEVTSIPLGEITKIRHARGGGILSLFDRLFGVGDLQVFVKDSKWVQCSIEDVKGPGQIIKDIRKVTNAEG